MPYIIHDMQGGGLMKGRIFNTLDEARDALRSFHSIDVDNTDKMSLDDLCEIGSWEVEEIKGK